MDNFLAQLRHRQVFKVATIYAVSAWPLIQIADLAVPALGLPDSVMTVLLQVFLVGFPVSLIFSWLYNFTSKGIVRVKDGGTQESTPQVNIQTTLSIAGTLALAVVVTLACQLWLEGQTPQKSVLQAGEQQPIAKNVLSNGKKESIAILPFIPFSNDVEDEFFADGMVEELLNLLAKIPDLQVAARTSSFAYKGVSNKTIVEIGRELGVDTILEGSIRKNDTTNRIRVTAQLIKVSTGEHLWSETYDREYRDIFQIQDDIARAVVDKMKVTLLGITTPFESVAETNNVDAMVAFGKGQQELAHRTAPSINKALQHFKDAVKFDSDYARAFVSIANANILLALYGNLPEKQANSAAKKALNTAFKLNPNLAAAHATQGLLLTASDSEKAEQSFIKAININPNYAMTYMWYGSLLQSRGDVSGAHKLFEQAYLLDPKSPVAAYNVAWGYYQTGSEKKAMDIFSQIISNDPYYPGAYNLVGDILSTRGRLDESISMYARALDVDPVNKMAIKGLLIANMDMGKIEQTQKWFDYANKQESQFSADDVNFMKARFYATQGDVNKALNSLKDIKFTGEKAAMNDYIEGEIAFYQGKYAQAITAFKRLRSITSMKQDFFYHLSEGQSAIHLAYAYLQIEDFAQAQTIIDGFIQFLDKDKSKKSNEPSYYYNMALINALQNKDSETYQYLQGAIDAGWIRVWQADLEPILAKINKEEQFGQMMGGIRARLATMRSRSKGDNTFLLADSDTF
ncbi:tetratricopeptide repeat protein [Colwellia demingiae]|uniref:Tetratricopeptide repeat protein n=1 Tax=Colwellia demingiae TaxID=89401 RepID=A0A5C6QS74_9GAMM|nr:tetratricopeptide repeat protein [Colwellia demingiae]TWX71945.1 tetratricopeptide repeat protein [Colwellia demingiae]